MYGSFFFFFKMYNWGGGQKINETNTEYYSFAYIFYLTKSRTTLESNKQLPQYYATKHFHYNWKDLSII